MKTLVAYYSYSGNTDRVAKMFGKMLEAKGEVHVQRLKPANDIKGFIGQFTIIVFINFIAVHKKKGQGCRKSGSFVSINEGMI